MSETHDRIRSDENAMQKLMEYIPGFDGYREREIRRAADKALRESLVAELDKVRGALNGVTRQWARAGRLTLLDDIDRLSRLMGKARDNIQFADYGYTGFFDAVKIKEEDLDRLYEHDLSLRAHINACARSVEGLAAESELSLEERLALVEGTVGELQEMVDTREQVCAASVPEVE